jgi:hypothetical protein
MEECKKKTEYRSQKTGEGQHRKKGIVEVV